MSDPQPPRAFQNEDQTLEELAQSLAFNYFSVSFGPTHKGGDNDEKQYYKNYERQLLTNDIFTPEAAAQYLQGLPQGELPLRARNVLVIGAGASFDAYHALPLGKQTTEWLKKDLQIKQLERNTDINNKFLEEERKIKELRRGSKSNGSEDPIDFENYLSILTNFFTQNTLREKLKDYFGFRQPPCLFYEIVAHMFKHGFIDVIINFNFDELLERTIEEEMGQGNYAAVFSDGDCRNLSELLIEGRLKVPLYIKPHGTASYKSSLRFTKDHYLDLPREIHTLIGKLLSGQLSEPADLPVDAVPLTSPKLEMVNLICVGFNMQSVEFNRILEEHLPKKSRIYYFTYAQIPEPEVDRLNDLASVEKGQQREFRFVDLAHERYHDDPYKTCCANVFHRLWKIISAKFKPPYEPRGLTRHLITTDIFYDKARYHYPHRLNARQGEAARRRLRADFGATTFFQDKVLVEMAIALTRTSGIFELKEMMEERVGQYFEEYLRSENFTLPKREVPRSIKDFMNVFYLRQDYSFSSNLYNLAPPHPDELEQPINPVLRVKLLEGRTKPEEILALLQRESWRLILFRLLRSPLFSRRSAILHPRSGHLDNLYRYFHKLHKFRFYDDINPRFYDRRLFIFDGFSREHILHTTLALRHKFNETFYEPDKWDALLLIAERGRFIQVLYEALEKQSGAGADGKLAELRHKKIVVIACMENIHNNAIISGDGSSDLTFEHCLQAEERRLLETFPNLTFYALPYFEHNHHMAIFLRKNQHGAVETEQPYPHYNYVDPASGTKIPWVFVRSIYYYRQGFSRKINPICIRGQFMIDLMRLKISQPELAKMTSDHYMLTEAFWAFVQKAKVYRSSQGRSILVMPPSDTSFFQPPPAINAWDYESLPQFMQRLWEPD